MFTAKRLHRNEQGQTALETAIILIAFVVVASVFAFTILSAGQASTDKGKQAINAGLEGVQSSMTIKGAMIGKGTTGKVSEAIFTLALVSGGAPVDLDPANKKVVISYRDAKTNTSEATYTVKFIGNNNSDKVLDAGELAEITVSGLTIDPNTAFTIEVKPPTGAVLLLNRTTPASVGDYNELN
ncbi:MAG: hypothetical protein IT324_03225 [Anaerolineae bacterium]|nr:hypothetical protein [Anaerolineae bacterium]